MAFSFKNILPSDISYQTEPVHEAIPITGTIFSGAFSAASNVKTYTHGMFQSLYDYTYTQASANHLLDVTFGFCSGSTGFANTSSQDYSKKVQIYNQMAQVLSGYDVNNQIRQFDEDGTLSPNSVGIKIRNAAFLNFSRLLTKDGIKKGTFQVDIYTTGTTGTLGSLITLSDFEATGTYKTNSPAGEYGILYGYQYGTTPSTSSPAGLIFYQAGVAVIPYSTSSIASLASGTTDMFSGGGYPSGTITAAQAIENLTIDQIATSVRQRIHNLSFNNTVDINSTFYLCSLGYNDFNYSSNPTYTSGSKIEVKNFAKDPPISYITTIGLYSPNNELLAVAKLSEPIKKTPTTPVQIKVRVSY